MPNSEELAALIAEYRTLNRTHDAPRIREICAQAALLVDRQAEPQKWAAFRTMFAQLSENDDPEAALAGYQDGLTVWTPDVNRDGWVQCHGGIGGIITRLNPVGSAATDEAIIHLELVIDDQPFYAETLALLYRYRAAGDLADNWERRVKYLKLAQSQVSSQQEPGGWAHLENELGVAYAAQPDADYNQAIEKRIQCHQSALTALREENSAAWTETCLNLGECYLFRVTGDQEDNLQQAEKYSRGALAACASLLSPDLQRQALLSLGRVLSKSVNHATRLQEALTLFDQAGQLIDLQAKPELAANVDAMRANIYFELLRLGDAARLKQFVESCEAALRGFDPHIHRDQRRMVLQVKGEGLLEAGDFVGAEASFETAVQAGELALAEATTQAGRMERIFQLRDTSALLSYCYLHIGEIGRALQELERGKTRFWSTSRPEQDLAALPSLIPENGALLFPVFASSQGVVVAVTRHGTEVHSEAIWLPDFSRTRLLEFQSGPAAARKLGGWLGAYSYRRIEPENWRREIDSIGEIFHHEIWTPVLAKLAELGVTLGAELVWFPQGGSGVFPMHAAWKTESGGQRWLLEDYAVRYAPSAQVLLATPPPAAVPGPTLIVANPLGDLRFSDLESVWVRRSFDPQRVTVLSGAEATKEALLASLPGCGVAHFSTHATFSLDDPFDSCLMLANGERLTLTEWLPSLRKQVPPFVVLSACETAMARVTTSPDEFLGFPAAFLECGTRTVLATLWAVDDSAAAILVSRFYQEYAAADISPAQALRRAQNWLRTLTVPEVSELLRELREEPAPVGPLAARLRTQIRGFDAEHRPFAEPYYWAAFTVSGH